MDNKAYYTLPDGTVIDDAYVDDVVARVDDALREKKARICPNPHRQTDMLHTEYSALPAELKKELKPFILGA
jgi:hypothetical protein